MVSKELVLEIFPAYKKYKDITINISYNTLYIVLDKQNIFGSINIYELADKCKEWAISNDICISSGNGLLKADGFYCSIDGFIPTEEKIFYANTEPEAIFEACKWILDNKEK